MDALLITKIISALSYPAGLLLVFAVLAFVFARLARTWLAGLCRFGFVAVLVLSTNPQFATWLAGTLERQYPQLALADIKQHDAIIVLGGGLRIPLPPAKQAQITAGSDRYWYATQLYRASKAKQIVLAGGNVFEQVDARGETVPGEAFYAKKLLFDWGVPESAIVAESLSRNTEQNRNNVADLLASRGIKSVLLVTSATHMPRAMTLFAELPVELTAASADVLVLQTNSPAVFDWLPSVSAMQLTTQAIHEYYGLTVLYLSRMLKAFTASD